MANEPNTHDAYRELADEPIRFRLRHILYLVTATCAVLGIPWLMYIFGVLVGAWMMFALIVGPLMFLQLLFILLVPPLRNKLLKRIDKSRQNPPPL
jgi:hypothetical protein